MSTEIFEYSFRKMENLKISFSNHFFDRFFERNYYFLLFLEN